MSGGGVNREQQQGATCPLQALEVARSIVMGYRCSHGVDTVQGKTRKSIKQTSQSREVRGSRVGTRVPGNTLAHWCVCVQNWNCINKKCIRFPPPLHQPSLWRLLVLAAQQEAAQRQLLLAAQQEAVQ